MCLDLKLYFEETYLFFYINWQCNDTIQQLIIKSSVRINIVDTWTLCNELTSRVREFMSPPMEKVERPKSEEKFGMINSELYMKHSKNHFS